MNEDWSNLSFFGSKVGTNGAVATSAAAAPPITVAIASDIAATVLPMGGAALLLLLDAASADTFAVDALEATSPVAAFFTAGASEVDLHR